MFRRDFEPTVEQPSLTVYYDVCHPVAQIKIPSVPTLQEKEVSSSTRSFVTLQKSTSTK
jgi:hypothetical protein